MQLDVCWDPWFFPLSVLLGRCLLWPTLQMARAVHYWLRDLSVHHWLPGTRSLRTGASQRPLPLPMVLNWSSWVRTISWKGISHVCTACYDLKINGSIEHLQKSQKNGFRALVVQGYSFSQAIRHILLHYRATEHSITGISPTSLMLGSICLSINVLYKIYVQCWFGGHQAGLMLAHHMISCSDLADLFIYHISCIFSLSSPNVPKMYADFFHMQKSRYNFY